MFCMEIILARLHCRIEACHLVCCMSELKWTRWQVKWISSWKKQFFFGNVYSSTWIILLFVISFGFYFMFWRIRLICIDWCILGVDWIIFRFDRIFVSKHWAQSHKIMHQIRISIEIVDLLFLSISIWITMFFFRHNL